MVGGGHAGVEAALAVSRMGISTLLVTGRKDALAQMPCNPSIGGLAKSHLVYELDALGGEMGFNADQTALQEKTLNTSRGPAVRATRAQCDKRLYAQRMQRVIAHQPNLTVLEDAVTDLLVKEGHWFAGSTGKDSPDATVRLGKIDGGEIHQENPSVDFSPFTSPSPEQKGDTTGLASSSDMYLSEQKLNALSISGIRTERNGEFSAQAVVLTSGTALRGRIFIGHEVEESGGDGRPAANRLSESLERFGFQLIRLKTGTPPRLKASSCDFSKCIRQDGEMPPPLFSLRSRCSTWNNAESGSNGCSTWNIPNIPCWMTHTTVQTHEIIRSHLSDSALYGGPIKGTGVRYCPSIEDKIVRFRDAELISL